MAFSLLLISTSLRIIRNIGISNISISLFFASHIIAMALSARLKMPTFRTFIHELKHAIFVILTGNRIKDFHVDEGTGHVKYSLYSDKIKFAPFITLAPYFLPIFSLPVLISYFFIGENYLYYQIILIGFLLGLDQNFCYQEIHQDQTDLHKIRGGLKISMLYVASFQLLWLSIIFLWIFGGNKGFVLAGYQVWSLVKTTLN